MGGYIGFDPGRPGGDFTVIMGDAKGAIMPVDGMYGPLITRKERLARRNMTEATGTLRGHRAVAKARKVERQNRRAARTTRRR